MRHIAPRDGRWMRIGPTAVVNGRFLAGGMTEQGMLVSFWLLDGISGALRAVNDNLNPT